MRERLDSNIHNSPLLPIGGLARGVEQTALADHPVVFLRFVTHTLQRRALDTIDQIPLGTSSPDLD